MLKARSDLQSVVTSLLNGKQPEQYYLSENASQDLADALASRIDSGVAPSLCAHAMCASSAVGIVAVVKMLASRPMSTFNKAYNFGEPLRRACRSFVKAKDPTRLFALGECAKLLVVAKADLNQPDKYLKSKRSAAETLSMSGSEESLALLYTLRSMQQPVPSIDTTVKSSNKRKSNVDKFEAKKKKS